MIIFLKNIPLEIKKFELASFIAPVFNNCFLGKPTSHISIEDIEILSIQDVDSNNLEKHGLVRVFPNEVGRRLIKNLDGKLLKQRPISVREYVIRSAGNDPRNASPGKTISFDDRRKCDRRRTPLMNSWQKDPILVHNGKSSTLDYSHC
ncbi:MAG: hypothetical protein ACU841_14705 [Gammaproteobacteria bacterium]